MIGIYFSGTGNSKYAVELFCKEYENESLAIKDQKAVSSDRCTMCYRCVNKCPEQALTLLGKRVVEQCGIEKYI